MKGTLRHHLMRKPLRKIAGAALALLMVFTLTPATAHADPMQPGDYHVATDLQVSGSGMFTRITGTIDVSQTIETPAVTKVEGSQNLYTGNVIGSVEAADLFEGAYQLYVNNIQGLSTLGKKWENIIMFDKGQQFPTAQYTVTFPANFTVDFDNITVSENTNTISRVEKKFDSASNSVTIVFYLGNWNDYAGFFNLVAAERNQTGHLINVNIPYTADGTNVASDLLGTVSGSGICQFYKYGNFPRISPIVDISSPSISRNIAR